MKLPPAHSSPAFSMRQAHSQTMIPWKSF